MSGRRSQVPHDEAVTPVIGTILMIAIMMVVAGIIFMVALKAADHPSQTTPQLAFVPEGQTLVVASVPPNVAMDWKEDVRVSGTCSTHIHLTPSGGTADDLPSSPGVLVSPGDVLGNCAPGETLILSFIETEAIMFQHTY